MNFGVEAASLPQIFFSLGKVRVGIVAAIFGLSMPLCLIILMLAPIVTIIGYETRGRERQAAMLSQNDVT